MAGQISKQNQRQSQKRRAKSGMKYKAVRSHTITLKCPNCLYTKTVPSQEAYHQGGNVCGKCRVPAQYLDGKLIAPPEEIRMQHVPVPVKREPQVRK